MGIFKGFTFVVSFSAAPGAAGPTATTAISAHLHSRNVSADTHLSTSQLSHSILGAAGSSHNSQNQADADYRLADLHPAGDSAWLGSKEFVVKHIEDAGGVVAEDLGSILDVRNAAARNLVSNSVVVLVAGRPSRTKKFLMSVALGIPIVSSMWIRACLAEKTLLDYNAFRLSNGMSLELGHWCAAPPVQGGVFEGLRIYVQTKDDVKRADLEEILHSGGAQTIKKKAFRANVKCDFVVCQVKPSNDDVMFISQRSSAKIATFEWVSQCIIHQRLLPLTAHPKYVEWDD
ncbi:hypothetical protein HK105_208495 [Polyrhizophydium stewartii]|uniref:BRCT domain-containing protein n=1 Tax=Polyrhizophydium stewartii TaxID=2732419 RepID=A0ABR4MXR0_9FUNG